MYVSESDKHVSILFIYSFLSRATTVLSLSALVNNILGLSLTNFLVIETASIIFRSKSDLQRSNLCNGFKKLINWKNIRIM